MSLDKCDFTYIFCHNICLKSSNFILTYLKILTFLHRFVCIIIITDEKSPNKRKEGMFVKQSLHVTSTPNAPKTERQSSEENTGNVYIYKVP
jgi:hypothetical protein